MDEPKIVSVTVSIDDLDKQITDLRRRAADLLAQADSVLAFKLQLVKYGRSLEGADDAEDTRTRRQQIVEHLERYGPQTRKNIAEATGIPDGTIAYEMRDRDTFRQLTDGRWALIKDYPAQLASPFAEGIKAAEDPDEVPF